MHLKEGIRNCACANSGKDIFEPSPPVLTVLCQIWCDHFGPKASWSTKSGNLGVKSGGENKWSEITFSESDNSRDFHFRTLAGGRVVNHRPNKQPAKFDA